ncbi:MAG: homoserine dehydrogenase [Phycisphaeraceae bacterium]
MAGKSIGIGMIGCGTVGGGVMKLLRDQADLYAHRLGATLRLRRVLEHDLGKHKAKADLLPAGSITADADAFFSTDDMQIVIEVAGGCGLISEYVRRALASGRHVVTANKSLLAAEGHDLFALARQHRVAIAFEASCGGGIPIITALQFGLMANRIDALYGILNGTCNYILTEMTRSGKDYATALKEAQAAGYAEADPALDVGGQDTAQKLAVLASLAFGVRVTGDQVPVEGIDSLQVLDVRLGAELGYDIKLLAIAEHTDAGVSLCTHPCFIHTDLPLAQVHGPFNAVSIYGHATGHTMYYGRGAGEMPAAAAVVSDLLNVASGWYPQAFAQLKLWGDADQPATLVDSDDLVSRFYLRINALDVPGVMAKVTKILGDAGISLSAMLQHEAEPGRFVPVVITTHQARRGSVLAALQATQALDEIDGKPVCIRIVDMPPG